MDEFTTKTTASSCPHDPPTPRCKFGLTEEMATDQEVLNATDGTPDLMALLSEEY